MSRPRRRKKIEASRRHCRRLDHLIVGRLARVWVEAFRAPRVDELLTPLVCTGTEVHTHALPSFGQHLGSGPFGCPIGKGKVADRFVLEP